MRFEGREPLAPLAEIAALLPEPPEREPEPDGGLRIGDRLGAVEGGPEVVSVRLQPIQPRALRGSGELGSGALREFQVRREVAFPDGWPSPEASRRSAP